MSTKDDETINWEMFFEYLSEQCNDINSRKDSPEDLKILKTQIEDVIRCLDYLLENGLSTKPATIKDLKTNFICYMQDISQQLSNFRYDPLFAICTTGTTTNTVPRQGAGRPKLGIKEETLVSLRNLGFNWGDTAKMLLVSRWRIRRRVDEYGIKEITGYTEINDNDPDEHLGECLRKHENTK